MATPAIRPPALRGRWMAAMSRRLFSPESFELLVEPAIADLQLEESSGLAARVDAYATVWIGVVAACDRGVTQRARLFVRDNELVSLTGLALLHAVHSAWMVVLLLGLDGRVHVGRMLSSAWAAVPTPSVLAVASVVGLLALRAVAARVVNGASSAHTSIVVRLVE